MSCDELMQLLPDLLDGTLSAEVQAQAEASLEGCPNCRQSLETARQIRTLLAQMQLENVRFRVPAGLEARLFARIRRQKHGLSLFDLSSKSLGLWLIELVNIVGSLIDPGSPLRSGGTALNSPQN